MLEKYNSVSIEIKSYPPKEEFLNVWSHILGLGFSIIGTYFLIVKALLLESTIHILSYTIFGISMVILFSASSLYHASKKSIKRAKLKIFDHVAIYFLIAGTYTPFTLLGLKGTWGWSIFSVAWGIGIAGMILKLFFTGKFNLLSTLSYIAMGWLIVIAIKPVLNTFSSETLFWLTVGGVFYTVGAVLYSIKKIPFNHAIFHFFVLGGVTSHFIAVYFYL